MTSLTLKEGHTARAPHSRPLHYCLCICAIPCKLLKGGWARRARESPFLLLPHFKLWIRISVFDLVADWPEAFFFLVHSVAVCGFWGPLENCYKPVEVELLLFRWGCIWERKSKEETNKKARGRVEGFDDP